MWGEVWGTLVWRGAAAVPFMGPGGWLLLGAVLGVVGWSMLGRHPRIAGASVAIALLAVPVVGIALTVPHAFTNGTVADADQVNANFQAVEDALALPTVNALAMNAPWTAYGAGYAVPGYYKDASGIVHLHGLVRNDSLSTGTLATLPVGFRPAARHIYQAAELQETTRVDVNSAGDINVVTNPTQVWFDLSGISFLAEQ